VADGALDAGVGACGAAGGAVVSSGAGGVAGGGAAVVGPAVVSDAGGDWVTTAGSLISEITPEGTPVLRLAFGENRFSYRVNVIEPGELDPAAVRASMDAMHPRP